MIGLDLNYAHDRGICFLVFASLVLAYLIGCRIWTGRWPGGYG